MIYGIVRKYIVETMIRYGLSSCTACVGLIDGPHR